MAEGEGAVLGNCAALERHGQIYTLPIMLSFLPTECFVLANPADSSTCCGFARRTRAITVKVEETFFNLRELDKNKYVPWITRQTPLSALLRTLPRKVARPSGAAGFRRHYYLLLIYQTLPSTCAYISSPSLLNS